MKGEVSSGLRTEHCNQPHEVTGDLEKSGCDKNLFGVDLSGNGKKKI